MDFQELSRQARDLTPYGVIPPLMRVKPFLQFIWPMSRTSLFEAIRRRKFHTFLLKDDLATSGVRVIDTKSALAYLESLSQAARKQDRPALEHRKAASTKRKRLQREAALTSDAYQ